MTTDLTITELATITRRHPESLRRMAREGKLPGVYQLGRKWMISQAAADRLRNVPVDESRTASR